MSDLNKTLADRQKTHGDFQQVAKVAESLMNNIEFQRLSASQSFAVRMIVGKLARIVCGNPNEPDHWHDIAGYAKLVEDELAPKKSSLSKYLEFLTADEKVGLLAESVSDKLGRCSYRIYDGAKSYRVIFELFRFDDEEIDDLNNRVASEADRLGLSIESSQLLVSAGDWSLLECFLSEV